VRAVADYALSDSSNPERTYVASTSQAEAWDHLMGIQARIHRNTSALAVIAVRVLDDAHDVGRAEVESEHPLRAWFEAATPIRAAAYLTFRAAGDCEEAAARDLLRMCELTHCYQEQPANTQ
jgi:hypothetical protein